MSIVSALTPTKKVLTVDGVLSTFKTTIAQLNQVAVESAAASAEQTRIAAEATVKAEAAQAEAARATSIAERFNAIIG